MKLIVGLGNVGREYDQTRHNVGFMVVRAVGARHHVRWTRQGAAVCGRWRAGASEVQLMLPQTMMNGSGEALAAAQRAAPAETLLVLDDVNLPLGTLRLRPGGGSGGHHGLASCLERMGTDEVPRLRVGVGAAPLPKDLTAFVLAPFDESERPVLDRAIEQAVEACEAWTREGMRGAMEQMSTP